jgi:hypothetical protein
VGVLAGIHRDEAAGDWSALVEVEAEVKAVPGDDLWRADTDGAVRGTGEQAAGGGGVHVEVEIETAGPRGGRGQGRGGGKLRVEEHVSDGELRHGRGALIIAGVYVVMNLLADIGTVLATPRLRTTLQ